MDNPLVQCPFDKAHKVLSHRLPIHIVKCKASYSGPEMEKVTFKFQEFIKLLFLKFQCMYNATHYVPKGSLQTHYQSCKSFYEFHREVHEKFYEKHNIDENASEAFTEDDKSYYSF